ncbi:MAG TPA: MFS transporter [Solirubrobacteraceae bacterium]|nr:MFS transporter [Solirubrobacteraceae bacterium]
MSSYLRVLRHRDFRFLFLGQSASAVGDQVVFVALALYVTRVTGSPTDLGIVLAAQSLPLITLVLFGGVWADRLPRHRIMIVTDIARAILHGALAALIVAGGVTVAEMVVIEALFGAARAFFQPAYSGLLPQTIPDPLNQDAWALTSTTTNLAVLAGPALGTVLVLTVGAGAAFALDAATFVVSAALLPQVHPWQRGEAPPRQSIAHDLRAGFGEVRGRPWVWATIGAFTGAVFCAYATWNALAPILSRDLYGSTGVFGLFETVAGAGAVIGALVGIRWRPRRPLAVGLALSLLWPLQCLSPALASPPAVVAGLCLAAGLAFTLFEVWWQVALVRHIPPHALSRVSSYDWMGSLALMPLGFAVAGPLAAAFGARMVLGVGAAAALVMLALALTPRSTRELGGSAEQLADDVEVEAGGEPEVPDVDPLVRIVHERSGLE